MALQLTPLVGTTAFSDRMGDAHQDLVHIGRIVQGHNVSGPMSPDVISAVNRDLRDSHWRALFHQALQQDFRFQRGLFDISQLSHTGNPQTPATPIVVELIQADWEDIPYQVETIQALSRTLFSAKNDAHYEYGFALIKTAAALVYTIHLCQHLCLTAITDSQAHHRLLMRTAERDGLELPNACVQRKGY